MDKLFIIKGGEHQLAILISILFASGAKFPESWSRNMTVGLAWRRVLIWLG